MLAKIAPLVRNSAAVAPRPRRSCATYTDITDDGHLAVLVCGHMEPSEETRELDYRFTLANERTFLAWIRTALALLAGGVAVVQLVPALSIPGFRHGLGTVLTVAGGVLAVLAVGR